MKEKSIVITCKTDGTFSIEAFGFDGNTCEKATAPYEEALGGETIDKKRKAEYFNVDTSIQSTKVNGS
ncbi:DUF2997 domain-containing protein [Paenibacillus oralis]|uniref:DUF2997 domain-containing protein n=1 Tax=Paenibacillus oralis TaxID=2490856 RepID=A0A3P3TBA3_9BACL|nr:DUF2997 domain-containing protein [Paenibacillus oralis]RRJ54809.1 DUF2997 domain-containing protein [Paenibacillus oralis]